MISIALEDLTYLTVFWLGFSRIIAILVQLPLFDGGSIPMMLKILVAMMISYVFFPYYSKFMISDIKSLGDNSFVILTIFNVLVGSIIGFFVRSIMQIFIATGSVITQQIGFSALKYFDPTTVQRIGPFEKLISLTITSMILFTGALVPMFEGMLNSFRSINYGNWAYTPSYLDYYITFFKSSFETSLMLASPIIFTNILIMSVLGIISRIVPQMNIIMMSFVVNIGLGILVFIATSDEFFKVSYHIYANKLSDWFKMLFI
jgi:flagellar biosynthetic protein FliR